MITVLLLAAWLLIVGLFIWSLCRIAAEADEALDRERGR